ncbi:glycine cleavage system protein GcvH [Desulfothermus okinawensis JCM 13304]
MKEIQELIIPEDLKYTKEHEWARLEGDRVRVGITDFAQDQLGDIVFVELPEVGSEFNKEEQFATVESVKAVSEVYMPVSGKIVEINQNIVDSPELVNSSPYDKGWFAIVKPRNLSELDELMDNKAYLELLKGEEEK